MSIYEHLVYDLTHAALPALALMVKAGVAQMPYNDPVRIELEIFRNELDARIQHVLQEARAPTPLTGNEDLI